MTVILLLDTSIFAGTERHLIDLALSLSCEVIIGCRAGSGLAERAQAEGLRTLSFGNSSLKRLRFLFVLADKLRQGECSVIHAHNGTSSLTATLARLFAGKGHVVLTQHFIEPAHVAKGGAMGWLRSQVHAWIVRSAARSIVISQAVGDALRRRMHLKPGHVVKVLNGIRCFGDAPPLQGIAIPPHVAKQTRFICVARLDPEKGHDSLVKALSLLLVSRRDWVCSFVGEGGQRQPLEDRLGELGLRGHVELTGFRSDVRDLMAKADVLVLPAPDEPFGLVLLEAMALGKPVIAIAQGGPLEIVEDGQTGLLVPANDTVSLAGALDRLCGDPAERNRMGEAGRQRFLSCFTAERMARETLSVYQAAVVQEGMKV